MAINIGLPDKMTDERLPQLKPVKETDYLGGLNI